jgi:hypothetical protein
VRSRQSHSRLIDYPQSFDALLYGGGGAWVEGGYFSLLYTSRTLLSKIIRISSSVRSTCVIAVFRISRSLRSRSLSSSSVKSRCRSAIAVPPLTSWDDNCRRKRPAPDHRHAFSSAAANSEAPRQPSSIEESQHQVKDRCTSQDGPTQR